MDTAGMDADGLAAAVTKQGSLVRQMKKVRGCWCWCQIDNPNLHNAFEVLLLMVCFPLDKREAPWCRETVENLLF